jgi:hypothetical protein
MFPFGVLLEPAVVCLSVGARYLKSGTEWRGIGLRQTRSIAMPRFAKASVVEAKDSCETSNTPLPGVMTIIDVPV